MFDLTVRALPGLYSIYKRRQFRYLETKPYKELDELLDRERPDALIHPCVLSGVYLDELVYQSKQRSLPLVTIMNSWDNPATKSSVFDRPEHLLVWGPQTKNDGIRYMGMSPKNVIEFGAAQFKVYRNPPRISRDEFNQGNRLVSDKITLMYAGSSKDTDEFSHLRLLDEAVKSGAHAGIQILYRPHPWGRGGQGGQRILEENWKHVNIESTLRGYLEEIRAGRNTSFYSDYRDTHDVLSHIDVLVSPLSTINLEAALHRKPVMCFLPDEDKDSKHFTLARGMAHFDDMFDAPEVVVEEGDKRLVRGVQRLLNNLADPSFPKKLESMCAHFVTKHEQSYGDRLNAYTEKLLSSKA